MNTVFKTLLTLCILHVSGMAAHVHWLSNFNVAHAKALKENKALLVFLIKKRCDTCTKMLRESFSKQKYIEKINVRYVSVILYQNQLDSYPIEMLYTLEYPSLFLLDNREIFISKPLFGYETPKAVEAFLFP